MFILKKDIMISQLINYLLNIAKKHILVNYVGYNRKINVNSQNNTRYYQFIIDNESLLEKQIVEGILTLRLNIDVLGFVDSSTNVLEVQDNALHCILDVMEYIDNDDFPIEVRDYSIVSFSEYSDDNSAGIRTTLQLVIPSPINLCEYKDNFIDKEEEVETEIELNVDDDKCTNINYNSSTSINLNPIKLS